MDMTTTTADTAQSTTPWRCEVAHHAHLTTVRDATCRPDSLRHPELSPEDARSAPDTTIATINHPNRPAQ
jgi:hypothetical protein